MTRGEWRRRWPLARYFLARIVSGFVTLLILGVGVFFAAQVLPGNPGRAVLGPTADPAVVEAFNERLGYNRPVLERFWVWFSSALTGDFGTSYVYNTEVGPLVATAFGKSMQLGLFALLIVIPLSLIGGVVSALYRRRALDRVITIGGMSLSVVPEFVTGIALLLVFGLWLRWFPVSATAPYGATWWESLWHLVLPSLALAAILFGYIARVARAGVIDALESDFTRTAVVKGVSTGALLRRHVLRNGLLPTVAVAATQVGYMTGGLVVIEKLFNYQGLGLAILQAGERKDFPVLQASILVVGVLYIVLTLISDLIQAWLNPAVRAQVTS